MALQWNIPTEAYASLARTSDWVHKWTKSCADDRIQELAVLVACAVGAGMQRTKFSDSWNSESDTATISPLLHSQEAKQFVAVAAAMVSTRALSTRALSTMHVGALLRHILREMPATDPMEVMPTSGQWEALVRLISQKAWPTLYRDPTTNGTPREHWVLSNSGTDPRASEALQNLVTVFGVPVTVRTKLSGPVNFVLPLGTTSGLVMEGTGDLEEYTVVVKKPFDLISLFFP